MDNILIYQTSDNQTQVEVKFDFDTVWLTQLQMAELFNQTKQNISLHINNCFKEQELIKTATVKEYLTVQEEGNRSVKRQLEYYNLDVIISVGYRVKSLRGTQFRQWATQRLKDFLVQGYAINQKRLEELGRIVQMLEQTGNAENLQISEVKGLLEILSGYTKSFVLLNQYDSHNVNPRNLNENVTYEIEYNAAKTAIAELKKQLIAKKEATELFGKEKDESFKSSLSSIVQTFGGIYLYPSIEEQAAHLLYFVVKNHSFNDGNKRIGAFLFVWFLEKNRHRFKKTGEIKINDNGLVAVTLLVAQSNPLEKELLVQLIVALIAE